MGKFAEQNALKQLSTIFVNKYNILRLKPVVGVRVDGWGGEGFFLGTF